MLKEKIKSNIVDITKAAGLVFGDIGTSPIYTLSVIFLTVQINTQNILSILSLIIWTLILLVTLQYAVLAMSLSKRGEGGAIMLSEILKKYLRSSRAVGFFSLLAYTSISFLIGDSIITPAISMLSAMEGLKFIWPNGITQNVILVLTVVTAIVLFSLQKSGSGKLSKAFGPIMVAWFAALALVGLFFISQNPGVFAAFNPMYGLRFITHNGIAGFFILSQVILCATGAEALYADMGHLGRKPIIKAWALIFVALVINYLGQGAFLISHTGAKNVLFEMVLSASKFLYMPFLILSIFAVIIASQAMISSLFSIIYQGINTRIMPLLKVSYTSEKINSQIYIPSANWLLVVCVIFVILFFKESSKLAAAYGFTVTGTICITAILTCTIFILKKKYLQASLAFFLCIIDFCFFIAVCSKVHHGAYLTLIIALISLSLILIYIKGNRALYRSMHFMSKQVFEKKYIEAYTNQSKIEGTALYFIRSIEHIAPYIVQTMFVNNILYTENIFVNVRQTGNAFGLSYKLGDEIFPGLRELKISIGYMEKLKIEEVLKSLNINEKAIFYGVEDIKTTNFFYNIYALIKKVTPVYVSFHNFPIDKAHGVICEANIISKGHKEA